MASHLRTWEAAYEDAFRQQQERISRALATYGGSKPVEVRDSIRAARHSLAIEGGGRDLKRAQSLGYSRHTIRPVVPPPAKNAHATELSATDEAKAIVFDLKCSLRASRDRLARRREARLNEAGRSADATRIVPVHDRSIAAGRMMSRVLGTNPVGRH